MFSIVMGWVFGLLFLALVIFSLLAGRLFPALIALIPALLLLPPIRQAAHGLVNFTLPWWARTILVLGLFIAYGYVLIIDASGFEGVYKSPEIKAQHMEVYDEKLSQSPTEFKDVYVDTSYGKVHVIVSGPEDGQPILLLNAAAMSGWSWLYNVGEFNKEYHTYSVHTLI